MLQGMAIDFQPIWFDSLGAKSSCTLVRTPDTTILIDPGCAVLQPRYPLPEEEKLKLLEEALKAIVQAAAQAEHIVITHYHHDHYLPFPELYSGKKLWIKDPNRWINRSQWERAREFLAGLAEAHDGTLPLKEPYREALASEDPESGLRIAMAKDFGDYQERREELLKKGRERLARLKGWWQSQPWVDVEGLRAFGLEVEFADGKSLRLGETTLRFSEPLFHGIEYSTTGWVIAVVIEHSGEKLLYSSDLEGPTIEDYAEWIIKEGPTYLILDGPTTYLLGYMLNRVNLQRAVVNARRIAEECKPKLRVMIYDHHLLRDVRYQERTAEVWEASSKVVTAAEWLGLEPLPRMLAHR